MKKSVVSLCLAALVCAGVFYMGEKIKSDVPVVEIMLLESTAVRDSINCSGKIVQNGKTSVKSTANGIITEMNIELGDQVYKGQKLFTITKADTDAAKVISENLPSSDEIVNEVYSAFMSGNYSAIEKYDDVIQSFSSAANPDNAVNAYNNQDKTEMPVYAPSSGIISEIFYGLGDEILIGIDMAVVLEENEMQVVLNVSESQIKKVTEGQSVRISGNGFSGKYEGEIKAVGNVAYQALVSTSQEATVEVVASIYEPRDDVKEGFTAKCNIYLSEKKDKLLLPYEVIRADEDGLEYVYVYENSTAKKKYIKTGQEYSEGLEIKSGLEEYEYVIESPDSVSDEMFVKLSKKGRVQ